MEKIKAHYTGEYEIIDDDVIFYAETDDGRTIREVYHLELAAYMDDEGNEYELNQVEVE